MIINFLEHCPKWEKDDGDYDSPTSQDETPDEKQEAIKTEKKSPK